MFRVADILSLRTVSAGHRDSQGHVREAYEYETRRESKETKSTAQFPLLGNAR